MSGVSVLVVDDDDAIRGLLATLLADEIGQPVLEAADGQEAVRVALEARPTVVLLDLMLPRMDGYAVAGHLRADARTRGCYLIANSAGGDPARALAAGANEFMAKPFDLDAVVERVQAAVAAATAAPPSEPADGQDADRSSGRQPAAEPTPTPVVRLHVVGAWRADGRAPVRRPAPPQPALGAICPRCGRRIERLSDHLLGSSPCLDARTRQPARRGPPPQTSKFLQRKRGNVRDLRASRAV
jgi:CheY-like chemotaxis protein